MKTQLTTLHNRSRTCATAEPVPGGKPVSALLMRLLWAAALVLPAVGAQAQQVNEIPVSPAITQYTVCGGLLTPPTLLVVSTTSTNPLPSTTRSGWIAETLTPSAWVEMMPGGSAFFPTVSWQSYTGLSWAEAFPPGTTHANGYFMRYHLVFSQACNCQAVDYLGGTCPNPAFRGDCFFQGAPESSYFMLMGPYCYANCNCGLEQIRPGWMWRATGTAGNASAASGFEAWQLQYFDCTNFPQAADDADPDGDGMSNTNEFLAGFCPTNSAAYPHIISLTKVGNDIKVTYLGANGDNSYTKGPASRTNVLEYTSGTANGSYTNNFVSTGQTNILSGGTGLGIITNMVDSGGATNTPSRYYRVRVLVP